jgi:hypothetical protein
VVTGGGRSVAEEVSVWDPHHDGVVFFVSREDFERAWSGHALIITSEGADANVFNLQPAREPATDTAGDISPTPPDLAEQHTPSAPMRAARAWTLSRATKTSQRSLGLPLGLAATTIVATAGIAVFLLIPPGADRAAGPSRTRCGSAHRRLTEQRNTVTTVVPPTHDSTSDGREAGVQINRCRRFSREDQFLLNDRGCSRATASVAALLLCPTPCRGGSHTSTRAVA